MLFSVQTGAALRATLVFILPFTLGATPRSAWALLDDPTVSSTAPATGSEATPQQIESALGRGVELLLSMQEGDTPKETVKNQWPYEGVYRVQRQIPIGYRVGGTSICAVALIRAPGFAQNKEARGAVDRAADFVVSGLDHPLMSPDYEGGYDVRGWGYTYALQLLLVLNDPDQPMLPEMWKGTPKCADAINRCIKAIQQTEIAQVGGWNYARAAGKDAVSPPSPFMTGPTLQALFEARRQGFQVDANVVGRALDVLERARTRTGSVVYSGVNGGTSREPVPGSVGRMLVSETTLYLAGRSTLERVRGAIDAFFTHWEWLEKRRKQQGTHVAPYGVAPYYFFYAHYYAAQAIEQLPPGDRTEYRRRLARTLMAIREDNGAWNDRVFDRSANYGTAMSMLALGMDRAPGPARWPGIQAAGPADPPNPGSPTTPE